MKNGDVYFGTDDGCLSKTGIFVKYKHEGYIEIGKYENGILQESMTIQDYIRFYWPNIYNSEKGYGDKTYALMKKLLNLEIDLNRKYF